MKIRVTSTSNFILFLKKLKVVDRSVLLELTETDLFCKVHTPDKSVMKFSRIPTNLIFDPLTEFSTLECDRIKIGLLDITRLMDSFRYFRAEEEVFLHLEIATIDDECVATELKLISPSLKIRIKCADLSLLSYVEDSISDLVQSQEDALVSFKFFVSDFSSVSSLCGMESNSEELLNFSLHSDYVRVIGESFDYKLTIGSSDIDCVKPLEASIYKSHLNYVDSESCICFFHENRIVFASDQTPTSTAIGIIEK